MKRRDEKSVVDRIRRLHARAAHKDTPEEEASTAHTVLVQWLNQYRPAVRYCYPKGVELRIVPSKASQAQAAKLFRRVKAHRAGAFTEAQRVLDQGVAGPALKRGFLPFGRYGYYVFVPLAVIEIRV